MQSSKKNQALLIFFIILGIALLYLLAPILSPFLLGALFAYLTDPLVKKLEKRKIPHIIAVSSIFLLVFAGLILLIIILMPIVELQIRAFVNTIPDVFNWVQESALPWLQEYINIATIKATFSAGLQKSTATISTVLASGYTVIEWAVNIILTPVVTFYLLRDWDIVRTRLMALVPKNKMRTVKELIQQCDEVLSGFFRGQLLVMLALCLIYGIGLSLIGLKTGLIIGLIGGLLSIVPFLGSGFVLVFASLASLLQFTTWKAQLLVLLIFFIGQALEGYVLTPYFIGERIGLHPVAVIFAIMAGGTLFGFFGVLLALPVAAVAMVLLQFINKRYLHVGHVTNT